MVLAVTVDSERSISAEIALIWPAASAEAVVSEVCASRALDRIDAAVSAPTVGERALDVEGQRLDVLGGIGRRGDQGRLRLAGAG